MNFTTYIQVNLSPPTSIFVTEDSQILTYHGCPNKRIDRWNQTNMSSLPSMDFYADCDHLFVDHNYKVYCSQTQQHQVVIKTNLNITTEFAIIAGTGTPGSHSNMLNSPRGIFVTVNLSLYVADCNNGRVQLFPKNQTDGITVFGNNPNNIISLDCPTGITLDAENNLFIVDSNQHRIIGSDTAGFRCIVGCSGSPGSSADRLYYPSILHFDSFGNLFVLDSGNRRIQKFILTHRGYCSKLHNLLNYFS